MWTIDRIRTVEYVKAATINVPGTNEKRSEKRNQIALQIDTKLGMHTHNGGGGNDSNDSGGWYSQTPAAAPEYM